MSFDSDERSVSGNRPIYLFTITITTPTEVFLHTSYPVDVTFGGSIFVALTMACGPQQLTNDQSVDELTITLPITHPVIQRYAASGIPPQLITVIVQRLQTASGVAQGVFKGVAQSLSVDTHTATLRCPALTADALKIQLPVVGATRLCNHRLFNKQCSPNPAGRWPIGSTIVGSGGPTAPSFQVNDTIQSASSDGLTLGCAAIGTRPSGWSAFGRMIMDTEQRRIISQVGTTITLAVPFVGNVVGRSVVIEAGCDHSFTTCVSKFNNQLNFGGHPRMSSFNAWASNGLGVIQQA